MSELYNRKIAGRIQEYLDDSRKEPGWIAHCLNAEAMNAQKRGMIKEAEATRYLIGIIRRLEKD